jgi:hypothetical protein
LIWQAAKFSTLGGRSHLDNTKPMSREFLTEAEMRSLCDTAEAAWRRRKRKQAKVTFSWNGQDYAAQRSKHELSIETAESVPVARRCY